VHDIEHHLAAVQPLLQRYGYAAVFVAVFVEGVGIPAPGQTLLIAAALLAARGELSLAWLLTVAVLASAGGNLAGFWLGRAGGRRLLDRIGAGPRLVRMEALFQRRGGLLVAFGRFVDGTRQLGAIVAGSLGMSSTTFLGWNVLGALAWAAAWTIGPFVFEHDLARFDLSLHRIRPFAIVLAVIAVVLALRWLRHGATATREARSAPP
jgi:membrane protein DedA with SNARE-associated domain